MDIESDKKIDNINADTQTNNTVQENNTNVSLTVVASQDDNSQAIDHFLSRVERQEYNKVIEDVKIAIMASSNLIKFTQQKSYKIPQEQYELTPKIYSISLAFVDKQIVTLEFKNKPQLDYIKNILIYNSAKYTATEYPIDEQTSMTLIKIEENARQVLAQLYHVYQKIAPEAGGLIWEALLWVIEDFIDKRDGIQWKEVLNHKIDAWAKTIVHDDQIIDENSNAVWRPEAQSHYTLKSRYLQLSDTEQEKFLQMLIKQSVIIDTQIILHDVATNDDRYNKIKSAFDTINKCNIYIQDNMPYALEFINNSSSFMTLDLEKKFEPSWWSIALNDEKSAKHVKVAGSATKAALSLASMLGSIVKTTVVGKVILATADVGNLVVSAMYGCKAFAPVVEIPETPTILEISEKFLYMSVICNPKILELDKASKHALVEFYSVFIHNTIKGLKYEDKDIFDYLLTQISNVTYIESLELGERAKLILSAKDYNVSISTFVALQNKDQCYEALFKLLNGIEQPIVMVENQLEYSVEDVVQSECLLIEWYNLYGE